jgi:hypothetical protein
MFSQGQRSLREQMRLQDNIAENAAVQEAQRLPSVVILPEFSLSRRNEYGECDNLSRSSRSSGKTGFDNVVFVNEAHDYLTDEERTIQWNCTN